MIRSLQFLAALAGLAGVSARADDSCVIWGINESGFKQRCGANTSSNAGDARPARSDGLATNPASLPVKKTPYGIEIIGSSQPDTVNVHYVSFGIIRGFKNFGVGLGTETDGTFYSNRASAPVDDSFPRIPSFSLGLATALPFFDAEKSPIVPIVGGSYKYNPRSAEQGYSGGLNLASQYVSLGASYQREPSDVLVPDQTSWNFNLAITGGPASIDFSYGLLYYVTAAGQADHFKSYIGTLSLRASLFTFIVAARIVDGESTPATHTQMYGVIAQVFARIRIGYFYDYRPGSHSLGIQALLF